jgi:hypothetical protein
MGEERRSVIIMKAVSVFFRLRREKTPHRKMRESDD